MTEAAEQTGGAKQQDHEPNELLEGCEIQIAAAVGVVDAAEEGSGFCIGRVKNGLKEISLFSPCECAVIIEREHFLCELFERAEKAGMLLVGNAVRLDIKDFRAAFYSR